MDGLRDAQRGEKIESISALSDWLKRSNVHGVFLVAQDKHDRTKINAIVVNGDDDFLSAAGLVCMDFIEHIAHLLDEQPKATRTVNRAERRRRHSRQY